MAKPNYQAQIDSQNLGQKILQARQRKNLSRDKLADLSGVSFYVIRSIEQGTASKPDPLKIQAILKALGE